MTTNKTLNTMLKTFLYLPMASVLVTVALAGPASAKKGVPFKGVIEGTEDFDLEHPSGIDIKVLGSGGGNATQHLGQFTATWDGDITFGAALQPNARHFVAANGDELWSIGLGEGTPPPNQFVTEEHVIIGGTGRFEGATGSFTVERIVFDALTPASPTLRLWARSKEPSFLHASTTTNTSDSTGATTNTRNSWHPHCKREYQRALCANIGETTLKFLFKLEGLENFDVRR